MTSDDVTETLPGSVQNFYFNGFQLRLSNADVSAVLMLSNVPFVALSMSYTTAKTLSLALAEMVETLERVTQRSIMTTKDVAAGIDKITPEKEEDGKLH
jgi:hypothetical protein